MLRDTRNTSRAESTGTVDREWIAGETPLLHTRWPISIATRHLTSSRTPAAAALLSTPPRNTAHHHSAALSHAGHDCCCCARPQSCCAHPSLSHHTDPIRCPSPSLACCSRLSLPPSRPPALISPIYPSPVRLVAAACCFVPIYRGRLVSTGLLLEERGGGLFEVFEISYRSATPQSAVL